jgi:hypothetical protein
MNDKPTKGECVLAKQLDKQLAEFLVEQIDVANNAELPMETRAEAMLIVGAILYGPQGDKRGS